MLAHLERLSEEIPVSHSVLCLCVWVAVMWESSQYSPQGQDCFLWVSNNRLSDNDFSVLLCFCFIWIQLMQTIQVELITSIIVL